MHQNYYYSGLNPLPSRTNSPPDWPLNPVPTDNELVDAVRLRTERRCAYLGAVNVPDTQHSMKRTYLLPLLGLLFTGFISHHDLTRPPQPAARAGADTLRLDPESGLVVGSGLPLVLAHCTGCHSAKLIQQHRFTAVGWTERIRWMQKNHKLWALGDAEKPIVSYLAAHYGPAPARAQGRRAPLAAPRWYSL